MEGTSLTEPLSIEEQMFLQRLMASQPLDHAAAKQLLQKCNAGDSLEKCFKSINKQLTAGFGLEICTVSKEGKKHHCVINMQADEVAKDNKLFTTPAECEYIRKILEALCNNEDKEESLARMDLINLRLSMDDMYGKFLIQQAESALDRLVLEKWIVEDEPDENRRLSQNKTPYTIGPRSYLELRGMLTDFGIEDLPQTIYYRSL